VTGYVAEPLRIVEIVALSPTSGGTR
jgi:hypothetical protein